MHRTPHTRTVPDVDLLRLMLGDTAATTFTDRPLADVFGLRVGANCFAESDAAYGSVRVIEAAKELIARALAETLQARDCFSAPDTVRDFLRLRMGGLPHEVFAVLLLDSQHQLIDSVELFRGTLNETTVYPREVVKLALDRNAGSVIFAHNHPSGVLAPSAADEFLTRALKDALALVNVRVLDHFIVGGTTPPLSFAERGLL